MSTLYAHMEKVIERLERSPDVQQLERFVRDCDALGLHELADRARRLLGEVRHEPITN